jgi:UDP-glucose 4-epimerase
MRIFVTGIAGFLASHLADRLLANGHEVVGVDNLAGGYVKNVPDGVEFHIEDCANRDRMFELMRGCDIVYHCACAGHEGLSIFSPHYITSNTFGTTISMISAALARKVKRFVLCSSAARYGSLVPPFTEDMLPKPQDPYGIAKYASDLALIELATTHGMEYSIAVPHNIIGTRQKYDDPYRNVASIFINLMLQGKSPIIYGDGLQERTFSFVSDVVDPLVKMGFSSEANGQIINVGPDNNPTSVLELAWIIKRLTGFEGNILHVPDRPREVRKVECSADKARRLLGYEAKKDMEEGLQEMVDWIRDRGTKLFQYILPVEIPSDKLPVTWGKKLF